MAEQKRLHGMKQDLHHEKYGKLQLAKLYQWLAELKKNQFQNKTLNKDSTQKTLYRYQEIL